MPPAPGSRAEVHFGESELRRVDGDAVVRTQGHFEPAAECRSVDGGDHRHGCVLHRRLHLVETCCLWDVAAEFADVGAGDERAAVADHDDGLGADLRPPG